MALASQHHFNHMTDIDVSLPSLLLSVEQRDELEQLLQPISEYYPSGPPIRFDPIFTRIRLAREEEDPGLPMGAWERPLKRADWGYVEVACHGTLSGHAKDLQIAAWLTEAWCRQHGIEGLLRGLLLVQGLLERFWETVHPQVDEDGDAELRAAPLQWMDVHLARTIRTAIPLLGRAAGQLDSFTLADWEHILRDETLLAKQGNGKIPEDEHGGSRHTHAPA
ncbi:type VI secretion system protein TssA [Massilia timonae]|uniref:type VI secretion system protein TssA n=1 Tax=Massilia timonae TaxID=47229 RepID=UPI0028D74EDF|nr:type VI secretion system protein TssA [Massilia timonae]